MPVKVLIVDDSPFMRAILKSIILKNDFELVGEAGTGLEALELYKQTMPDLVTMDIVMPEMDGIEAVKAIREVDPDAKILMVSAMGQQAMV
ncbi:MAG: response regulator, partial [bacterium]